MKKTIYLEKAKRSTMSKNRRLKMPATMEIKKKMKTKIASHRVWRPAVKKLRGNDVYPGGT